MVAQEGEPITINFGPGEVSDADLAAAQSILDEHGQFDGYTVVVQDFTQDSLVREFIDRGVPEEDLEEYLNRENPYEIEIPPEDVSIPWNELRDICTRDADPATERDDCTRGNGADEPPEPAFRFFRVREPQFENQSPARTYPFIIALEARRIIAIS